MSARIFFSCASCFRSQGLGGGKTAEGAGLMPKTGQIFSPFFFGLVLRSEADLTDLRLPAFLLL